MEGSTRVDLQLRSMLLSTRPHDSLSVAASGRRLFEDAAVCWEGAWRAKTTASLTLLP